MIYKSEQQLLGCVLLRETSAWCLRVLEEDDFTDPRHQIIFRHMKKVHRVDMVTVVQSIIDSGDEDKFEGSRPGPYLAELTSVVPVPSIPELTGLLTRTIAGKRREKKEGDTKMTMIDGKKVQPCYHTMCEYHNSGAVANCGHKRHDKARFCVYKALSAYYEDEADKHPMGPSGRCYHLQCFYYRHKSPAGCGQGPAIARTCPHRAPRPYRIGAKK